MDKLWNTIKGWIEKLFSSAGKEVLIKSVAQAVPVFSMSCSKQRRGLCEHLNKLIRRFWWGSKASKRKPAWVSWKDMIQPKFLEVRVSETLSFLAWHFWLSKHGAYSNTRTHFALKCLELSIFQHRNEQEMNKRRKIRIHFNLRKVETCE